MADAKVYRILPGRTFRDSDESIKGAGDTIVLSDEIAAQHRDLLEPVGEPPAARERRSSPPSAAD